LKSSNVAWVLGHAVRLAVATVVIALILATTLQGEGAERLATTAYLAAIFAGIALVIQRFLPAAEPIPVTQAFPAFFTFFVAVAFLISLAAMLVSDAGAETILIVACFGIVAVAVLIRSGTFAALNAVLVRGGRAEAAARYAVMFAIFALVLAALLPGDLAGGAANIAYRLMIFAALFLVALLIAPTPAGLFLKQRSEQLRTWFDKLARALVFERAATSAAVIAVAVLLPASFLPNAYAEPLAVAAYLAAAVALVCIAVECRRLRE
jgi:uncharacterized membrane protein YtjA (UPF0391 family)